MKSNKPECCGQPMDHYEPTLSKENLRKMQAHAKKTTTLQCSKCGKITFEFSGLRKTQK